MDPTNAEKTIVSLFQSKMIGKEINYFTIENDDFDDSEESISDRLFEVIFIILFSKKVESIKEIV